MRDHLTNAPIAGANVLAIWEGTTREFRNSNRHCMRIDATRTRPDGTFSLVTSAWNLYHWRTSMQFVDIRIFQSGMEEHFEPGAIDRKTKVIPDRLLLPSTFLLPFKFLGLKELGLDLDVRMIPTKKDTSDRLRYLEDMTRLENACESQGDKSDIQSYIDPIIAEARAIAKTRYSFCACRTT